MTSSMSLATPSARGSNFQGGEWRKIRINAICKGTSNGIPNITFGHLILIVLLLLGGGGGGGSKPYVVVSARAGYQLLLEELNAQLIDIRPLKDARDAITPDLKEAKMKAAAVLYNGEDKNGFMKKLTLRFKDPENTCRYF